MPVERTSGGTSLIDVLDRVLDRGVVIDTWARLSRVGIDVLTIEMRVVVASDGHRADRSQAICGDDDDDDDDDDDGSTGPGSGAHAATADILPRALPAKYRRPID